MDKKLTGYDEIESLEKNSVFSFEVYRSMTLFDMKKFIILDRSLVLIKDNQFKWEFDLDDECVSNIKGIINENERLQDIYKLNESTDEEGDNYKFTFYDHTVFASNISYPEENGMIVSWNSSMDSQIQDLTFVLDVFYKIIDELDNSHLELDIKREFNLEKELDEPFKKKYVQKIETISRCWIFNLDNVNNKYPWNVFFDGDLILGWSNLNGLSFDNKHTLLESVRRIYGTKCATNMNIEALWDLYTKIHTNDVIYVVRKNYVELKCIVSSSFKDEKIECRKSYYLDNVPFNGNRYSKNILFSISKEDSLIQYFEGCDSKDSMDVFPIHSTIYLGAIDSIKELKVRRQKVYLIGGNIVNLYKDKEGNYYMADTNYFEGFNTNYNFKIMEVPSPVEYIIDEGEPVVLKVTDFITRSNLSTCRGHKVIHTTARIKTVDADGNILEVYSPSFYCANCNRYYILEEDFERVKNNGVLLCKLVTSDYWKETQEANFRGYNEESLLHLLGYNVTQKDSLSDAQRQRILEVAVDHNILTKEEIVQFLDFLIHSRNNATNMESALKKWKKDKKHIQNYELESNPISVFRKVYLNEYIRLL